MSDEGRRRATLWVDADACPNAIKEILFRAAERVGIELILVANHDLRVPRSPYIRSLRVPKGFDVADRNIVERVAAGDVVVTADIPLAAEVVARGAIGLDPRGELYTEENVRERLAMRDLMQGLRDGGLVTGGPAALDTRSRQAFANALDRILARLEDTHGPDRQS